MWKMLIVKRKIFIQFFTQIYRFSSVRDKFKKGELQWKIKIAMKFLRLPEKVTFVVEKNHNHFHLLKEKANFKTWYFFFYNNFLQIC